MSRDKTFFSELSLVLSLMWLVCSVGACFAFLPGGGDDCTRSAERAERLLTVSGYSVLAAIVATAVSAVFLFVAKSRNRRDRLHGFEVIQ